MGRRRAARSQEHYAWPDIARRLEAIYERVARSPASPEARGVSRLGRLARNPWARGLFVLASLVAAILAALVARARLEHRLPRVRLRQLALGGRRRPAQPALGARARVGVEPDDPSGDAAPAPAVPARSSRRSASGCSGTPSSPPGRASSRASPCCAGTCPHGKGTSATLLGTVFAHRLFDLFPIALLVAYVMATAKLPHWAVTGVVVVGLVGRRPARGRRARRRGGDRRPCPTHEPAHCAPRCSRWRGRGSQCSARRRPPSRRSSSRPSAGRCSSSPCGR